MARWGIAIIVLLAIILLNMRVANAMNSVAQIKNIQEKADFERLPVFYTSDSKYDEFVNEYFIRHLSADERGVHWVAHPVPGVTDHLWVVEWDTLFFNWIDRGALGLGRQQGSKTDMIINTLLHLPVDKYGYTFGSLIYPEPNESLGGARAPFSWPWPKYNWNSTVKKPTGWEFNDPNDGSRNEWTCKDIELEPGYVNYSLAGKITGPNPELLTPEFDVDVYHVPIIELDIAYQTDGRVKADQLVQGLKIYWTTDDSPQFSEDKMVTVDYCDLPPKDYRSSYEHLLNDSNARHPLYFPMYLHPNWGKEGRHITRLKIVPSGSEATGVKLSFNYIRATYDVRNSTSNSAYISSVHRMYMWSGDTELLKATMPKLRKSMIFMNEHLRGREEGLLNFEWIIGKDGLGDKVGGGMVGSYWDLLPAGKYDLESSISYYNSLLAMAELEIAAAKHGIEISDVSVIGPDNKTILHYNDSADSLRALAANTKKQIEKRFWNAVTGRFVRNIDIFGNKHDYGFLHHNLLTLAWGIGTKNERDLILSWLDGRVIPGDTSTGKDIYKWRFAPRTSTKANNTHYNWPWVVGRRADPKGAHVQWGNQMQDGGAVPFTSLFEMMARVKTGKQEQIDRAFERTKEVREWFYDVKAAGGEGAEFYRAYYNNHPERGLQQGGGPPGGLGLDREFLSDSCLGTLFLFGAFLGIEAVEDGVLSVSPALPTQLDKIGVKNVFYRGNYLTIESGRSYVSFEGSKISNGKGLKVKVTLSKVPKKFDLLVDGKLTKGYKANKDGSVSVITDLAPVRIEVAAAK